MYFANSHAVFPAQTMPNAAAIATGHYPGDTGQFANLLFIAFPLFDTGNFGQARGTMVPDVEDALVLGDINDHFGGNYLREASLLALARLVRLQHRAASARRARRVSRCFRTESVAACYAIRSRSSRRARQAAACRAACRDSTVRCCRGGMRPRRRRAISPRGRT